MQRAVLCLSLLMLTNLYVSVECDFVQNFLQRGAKPSTWKWTSKPPDVQRHRRFLPDDTAAWWKEMQSLRNQRTTLLSSISNPLNPEEDIYFSGKVHQPHPPFDRIESAPLTTTTTTQPPLHNFDPTFVRELIIEEHHRPSKTELESASQRLREANNDAILKDESSINRTGGDDDSKSNAAGPASSVEYVVPGVEHVLPQVEYVSELDAVRELEHLSLRPSVEYIEPFVEYIEPEIQYISTRRNTDISESSVHISDDSTSPELEREFEEYEPIPYEESITIDRKRFLQFRSKNDPSGSEHLLRGGEETVRRRSRIHRRNPEMGVPEVDYPTLEILPVVHFPCEEYPEPGYYADVTSRCQMFHRCHGDGQRSSFLCPVGTVFNQDYLVCDWWYNVPCTNSLRFVDGEPQDFHKANKLIGASSDIQKEIDNTTVFKPVPKQQSMEKIQQKSTYQKSHGKDLSSNKLTKLSKKAINYPMGYAILLREYMKTSPGYLQNLTNAEAKTEKSNNERNVDGDGLKQNKLKPKKSYIKQKQEYYGGLKPFTLSEKTVRESTHIKRIKMKHPPNESLNPPETALSSAPRIRNHAMWYGERDMVSPTLESLRHYRNNKIKDVITPSYKKTNSSLLNRSLDPERNVTESYEAMHSIQRITQVKVNPKITEPTGNRNNSRRNPRRYFLNKINNNAVSKMKLSNPAQRYTFNQTAQKKYQQILPAVSGVVGENTSLISPQKKAYILEPNSRNMKLSKRYGERLCLSCLYKNKASTIVNETKHGGSETSVAKRTTPFIQPIKVYNVAKNETEHPNPVYFKRENDTERRNMKGDIKSLDIVDENIPLSKHDEIARSEYYYTSKFIKRISNLVSEIKSHSDSYDEMYPINNSFAHFHGLNSSKDEGNFRENFLFDKEKIQKMDLTLRLNISTPKTGSHLNATNIDKLNSTVANNSNHSLVRTGNGGYVIVKKVRLKSSLVNPEDIRDNAEMTKHENVRYYSIEKDKSP